MPYVTSNPKSKAALKRSLASGNIETVYSVSIFGNGIPENGSVILVGPHYPKPHTWYGTGTIKDGILVSVK